MAYRNSKWSRGDLRVVSVTSHDLEKVAIEVWQSNNPLLRVDQELGRDNLRVLLLKDAHLVDHDIYLGLDDLEWCLAAARERLSDT